MVRLRRVGVTLVEVLVVVAILGVLLALLLPAVQRVRAAAYRVQASNQFRQVVLGLSNFATQHGDRLPSLDGQKSGDPNVGMSPLYTIRPFVEANTAAVRRVMPDGHAYTDIPLYVSPLDPGYASSPTAQGNASVALNASVFRVSRPLGSISDGTSLTFAVAEHYAQCGQTAFVWSLMGASCSKDVNGVRTQIPCVNNTTHRATFADHPAADDLHPGSTAPTRTFQPAPLLADCDYRLPQAAHPGGLLTVMLDGSTRWVAPGVSPAAFWAAVTPSGGEILALD